MPQSPLDTHMQTCVVHTHTEATATRNTRSAWLVSKAKSASAFVAYCVFPPSFSLCFLLLFDFRLYGYFLFSFVSFSVVALHAAIPISLARAFKLRCPIGNLLQIHLNQ